MYIIRMFAITTIVGIFRPGKILSAVVSIGKVCNFTLYHMTKVFFLMKNLGCIGELEVMRLIIPHKILTRREWTPFCGCMSKCLAS